ncbi:hypothetical protein KQX54_007485 [Cotesia glomerata]|uniref:Uncharacterized protein n=1 Tax=Cotesia glomerata TaxID=32391 RepID=A0AAV7J318_COTGL|nr:hypothetical protein KQX54_007485 [Cotesia glomerata]
MGTSVVMVYELTHVCSEYGQMRYTWIFLTEKNKISFIIHGINRDCSAKGQKMEEINKIKGTSGTRIEDEGVGKVRSGE